MVANVIHINSVAAQMVLRFKKDHMVMGAIVHKLNSNVVQMVSQQQKVKTLKVAHAPQADMVVVQTVSLMHKDLNSMVVRIFQQFHKKLAVLTKMAALVAITQLNTSSIWNMVAVHVSGIQDAVVTIIALKRSKNVKELVKHHRAKTLAKYRRFMDHVTANIKNTIMTLIEIFAQRSYMVVAWAIQTNSKRYRNVNRFVS